jgi:rod shape determining protein RodA
MMGRSFEWPVAICTVLLCLVGAAVVASVAPEFFGAQIFFYASGLAIFFLFSRLDEGVIVALWRHLYLIAIILLAATLLFGFASRGAVRWLEVFGFRLQFSELLKPVIVGSLAAFLAEKEISWRRFFGAFLLCFLPAFLVLRQPDLGSALVYFASFGAIAFAAGISGGGLLLAALGVVLTGPIAWHFLADYQKGRIISFLSPGLDPLGAGYNAIQAVIAAGSGGVLGKGLSHGSQSQLLFLPEHHTDFIFASLAEELGFLGAAVVLGIYFFLIWRLFVLAGKAESSFARLYLVGTGGMLLAQVFINAGMNLGLMPVTGITLPLVSYGGSSVWATMIALGLACCLVRRDLI